ncbi:unnamed protein product [Rotaria sordida]|uniref:Peptidase S1 domain-containing protein n=1 Tax=Rotaria sordida TaxID=392033 RepID=A0A814CEV9_9BILA|nr:unnamed protein product [Rotaria sordida]CAF0851728.1 unnamed protein product [Rotaria sordida]CAF0933019.1 unnamed protein product [Rotaria sordida]CAF0939189.1 unnamed protein product [Rotaria sordida]CAF1082879.1 unnamed protein product [Rotaria sordida]
MICQSQLILFVLCFFLHQYLVQATIYSCNKTALCGCSKKPVNINARIVGGEIAASHSWGWAVSLRKSSNQHFCGGSILSPNYVLTAAHCVDNINLSRDKLTVVVGIDNLYDNIGQRIVVSKIYLHPNWHSKRFENDIAILKLNKPISFNDDNIAKLCLPSFRGTVKNNFPLSNSKLVAIGWGHTMSGGSLSTNLRQVTLAAVGNKEPKCSNSIKNTDIQFCAAVNGGGKDTCQGDSGGPLMYYSDIYEQWMLAGVTSFGHGCALANYAGVYTRATMYIDWIKSIVGNDGVVIAGGNTANISTLSTMVSIATLLFLFIMRSL